MKSLHSFSLLFLALGLFIASPPSLSAQQVHACVVMPSTGATGSFSQSAPASNLPAGVNRAVALGNSGRGFSNFWTSGSTIRIKFLSGSAYVRQKVEQHAREWTRYANVNMQFVTSGSSDIQISFVNNGSSWSMLGRQASYAPDHQATMNFGWFTDQTSDAEFRRTVLHEFGHALGLLHEHQNPSGGIPWDEDAVYAFYARTQGWDRQTTYTNVIARQSHNETQYSSYDARSIMHYPVDPSLTMGNYSVGLNSALSTTDMNFISKLYPGRSYNPPTTTTSGTAGNTPTRTRTQPTRTQPSRRTEPTVNYHTVSISNHLGQGVSSEVIQLTINNRRYEFRLQEGQRNQQTLNLKLRPGTYDYQVETKSVYVGKTRVWNGRRYVERQQEQTIAGSGQGRLSVRNSGQLVFYGSYDKQSGRMKVWLGEEEQTTR
ncbi:hypothetical protein CEQ90_13020 [Lewinellaceae bacterium SD302]|nr:hypothetical protein CEQ90_13020 [Lewinellaceae bacterium SD302]